jgi:cysteinyl-tRNA synthetase
MTEKTLSPKQIKLLLKKLFNEIVIDVLGLKEEEAGNSDKLDGLMNLILEWRKDVRTKKDFAASDKIRDELLEDWYSSKRR